jgi:hypothetical protein
MFRKNRLVAAVLGGFLLFGTLTPIVAADDCKARVRKAEETVNRERDRHGEHSKQAEQARRKLEKERANCPAYEHHDHDNVPHEPHEPR